LQQALQAGVPAIAAKPGPIRAAATHKLTINFFMIFSC
jgi:hypothetical protein